MKPKKGVPVPPTPSIPIVIIPRCPGGHPMQIGAKPGDRCPHCDWRIE